MSEEKTSDRLLLLLGTSIWGSIGIVRHFISLPSSAFACVRGLLGGTFVLLWMIVKGNKFDKKALKSNAFWLILAGIGLASNWLMLFECIRICTVSLATVCYYTGPIFVILLSSRLFGEKLTPRKILGSIGAFAGLALASGILNPDSFQGNMGAGLALGMGSAVMFATVTIANKKMKNVDASQRTVVEMLLAGFLLVPYVLATENVPSMSLNTTEIILILVAGLVHTGVSYIIYFRGMERLRIQTVSLYSYADPVVALLLSALILGERMGLVGTAGALMVILCALIAET